MRSRPGVMARVTSRGEPASIASLRSVCTISVQTAEPTKATSSGVKNTLSVRFAASTTWKSARATSRNSVWRGRASSSWSPCVSAAKCASAIVEGSPRSATAIVASVIPTIAEVEGDRALLPGERVAPAQQRSDQRGHLEELGPERDLLRDPQRGARHRDEHPGRGRPRRVDARAEGSAAHAASAGATAAGLDPGQEGQQHARAGARRGAARTCA